MDEDLIEELVDGADIDGDGDINYAGILDWSEVLKKVRVFSDWTREALSVRSPYTWAVIVKYANIFYWRAFRNIWRAFKYF